MTKHTNIKLLVLDDKYGKISSHWTYSTKNLSIVDRVYYDENYFEQKVLKYLKKEFVDAIAFSGRKAPEAASRIEEYLKEDKVISERYSFLPKVFKLHNTNLTDHIDKSDINRKSLLKKGNDWVRAALGYPFDLLLVQTYGDCDIFNEVLGKNSAHWIPYCYNDRLYYPRDKKKDLDIGAFFKLERHNHRIEFVDRIQKYAANKGYSFEFSDQYWGEAYAENICRVKILVHLSYCGDIPWRLYECAACKTCLLTDPLAFHVEELFDRGEHFVEYQRDFSDLESKIDMLLADDKYRKNIIENAYERVQKYTWENISDTLIAPLIENKQKNK